LIETSGGRRAGGSKGFALAFGAGASMLGSVRIWTKHFFRQTWPFTWQLVRLSSQLLPRTGPLRDVFTDLIFTRPWRTFYRVSYDTKYRNLFFEYIVTFLFHYPIRKSDIVVHVGASFGEETLRFAKSVGRYGRIIAVEPEDRNVDALRKTFTPERFPQVSIVQRAAAEHSGELRLFLGGEREHRLADIPCNELTYEWWGVIDHLAAHRYPGLTTVPADRLDNILRLFSLNHIDFVLIETNGSELEVVRGMEAILPITRRLGVRGHVRRDGVPINAAIADYLTGKGFRTSITTEGMVLAEQCPGSYGSLVLPSDQSPA
jgi:FkbM family methyltransferase